ncbi:putative nuclease HARBI1 [Argopecten irradians]|uniref:putative nuclease HARBI1 n=1 Tax=Argopecten irradians TaxID=31199 RepID=UPI003719F355
MASYLLFEEGQRRAFRRERVFRDRTMVLDVMDDTYRSLGISPSTQVLVALRYFAKGGFLSEIGDTHGVSRSSVSRIVTSVTDAVIQKKGNAISFPDHSMTRRTKEAFYDIAQFPNVVGAVDGTQSYPPAETSMYMYVGRGTMPSTSKVSSTPR